MTRELVVTGGLTLLAGQLWHLGFPINKSLWTSSYVLFTGGAALVVLGALHQALDDGRASPAALAVTEPLVALGRNALLLFVISGLVAKTMLLVTVSDGAGGRHSVQHAIYQTVFAPLASPSQRLAALCADLPGAALRAAGLAAPAPLVLDSVDFQGYGETIGRRRRGRRVRRLECVAPGARRLAGDPGRRLRTGERTGEFIRSLARDPRRLRRPGDLHPVGHRVAVGLALAGQDERGQRLVEECGVLFLGAHGSPHLDETAQVFRDLGVAHERLAAAAVAARYPQLGVIGLGDAIYEPRAGAIRARQAVAATVALARAGGVEYRQARVATLDETRTEPLVRVASGERLEADHLRAGVRPVAARRCSRWLWARGSAPRGRSCSTSACRPATRGSASSTCRCGSTSRPASTASPTSTRTASRSASTGTARPSIPTPRSGLVDGAAVALARDFLARRFPALAGAPLLDARVCQYENTSSGDFLIDAHPTWPNVWIVGGGSGHGFKHGPAVGAHVADLLAGRVGVDGQFSLAGKASSAARAVF